MERHDLESFGGLDFGGMLRGYAVDLTRTVGLGPVPDEAQRNCILVDNPHRLYGFN